MTTAAGGRGPSFLAVPPGLASSLGHQGRIHRAAVVSPVLAAASLVTFGLTAFPAIIVGHIALRQIKRTGQGGRLAAVGGLVLGYAIALIVVYVLAVLVMWGLGGGDA